MILAALVSWAAAQELRPPIREIDHPRYADASGRPLHWREVKDLARGSDALGQVRRRRAGRTVLRVLFAGTAGVEVWGTYQLARRDDWVALPLGVQTAATSLAAVLLWTNLPSQVLEDRALVVEGANGVLGRRR